MNTSNGRRVDEFCDDLLGDLVEDEILAPERGDQLLEPGFGGIEADRRQAN
jgi:hypothetical protein